MNISWSTTTPKVIKHIRACIIYAVSGSLVFTDFLSGKFGVTPLAYAEWCGIIIFASKVLAKFFGVGEDEAVQNVVESIKEVKKVSNDGNP